MPSKSLGPVTLALPYEATVTSWLMARSPMIGGAAQACQHQTIRNCQAHMRAFDMLSCVRRPASRCSIHNTCPTALSKASPSHAGLWSPT